jgi:hypothetical protein
LVGFVIGKLGTVVAVKTLPGRDGVCYAIPFRNALLVVFQQIVMAALKGVVREVAQALLEALRPASPTAFAITSTSDSSAGTFVGLRS